MADGFLNNPFVGYSYNRIILDQEGKPFDYEFLEVNDAFEKLTGYTRDSVINKTVRALHPDVDKETFNWIEFCGNIALIGGSAEIEQYVEKLSRWYKVYVYLDEPMHFKAIFIEITKQKEAEKN